MPDVKAGFQFGNLILRLWTLSLQGKSDGNKTIAKTLVYCLTEQLQHSTEPLFSSTSHLKKEIFSLCYVDEKENVFRFVACDPVPVVLLEWELYDRDRAAVILWHPFIHANAVKRDTHASGLKRILHSCSYIQTESKIHQPASICLWRALSTQQWVGLNVHAPFNLPFLYLIARQVHNNVLHRDCYCYPCQLTARVLFL